MSQPRVSIVVLNWNGLADTTECLESFQKVTYPSYKVIVVDNASTGNDVAILRERFGDYIHLIQNEENHGFAKGNNTGIRRALQEDAAYVLLLNNDTVVDPQFLNELVAVAEEDKGLGLLCPLVYRYDRPGEIWFGGGYKIRLWRGTCIQDRRVALRQPMIPSEVATGAAMLIRRETLQKIGLLPEYHFFGVEDFDYSLNAMRHGLRIVVVAKAMVWHKGSGSVGDGNAARIGYGYRGWQMMRRKYLSPASYIPATLCGLTWAAVQFVTLLSIHLRRGDIRGSVLILRKGAQGIGGTIQGWFSKPKGF